MNSSYKIVLLFLAPILVVLMFAACNGTDPNLPPNPYDGVDYGEETDSVPPPDPTSLVGIHENILKVKCNNPGCHDGTFEPDFRSVQSTFSTLVYHPIKKNTADEAFSYRVIPNNPDSSMLIRRLTVNEPALQQMPATGDYLTAEELSNITTWINTGALDMFGNPGVLPNNEPTFIGYIAIDSAYERIDTIRLDDLFYNPFLVDNNKTVTFVGLVEDDSTALEDLTGVKMRFSYDQDDFSGAVTVPAIYIPIPGFEVWTININTGDFTPGVNVYFRFYANDGDHVEDSQFPTDDHEDAYKTYSSMYVLP